MVLESALIDLNSPKYDLRKKARIWFRDRENLMPFGIGFQDVLDLELFNVSSLEEVFMQGITKWRRRVS